MLSYDQIVSGNLGGLENEALLDHHSLYRYLTDRMVPGMMTYIFLYGIQRVSNFHVKDDVDLCIKVSNAYLLSGNPAT